MASRYWIGNAGNVNDTAHWSASSGGAGGASAPTTVDDVFFDVNSITLASQTITLNTHLDFRSIDTTGVLNTPTFGGASYWQMAIGNKTFVGVLITNTGEFEFITGGAGTFTTNGIDFSSVSTVTVTNHALTFGDAFNCGTKTINIRTGNTVNTNGKTITCGTFQVVTTASITLGASIINCTAFTFSGTTLTANTSSIRVTGTGAFAGGDATYYEVQLNGTAHTITGNNTFTALNFYPSGAQTLTFTGTT